jgi:hypothetical protein
MDYASVVIGVIGVILSAITIFAIYYGPIQALKIQRTLDAERDERNRKLQLFKTLVSYRVTRLAPAYVQALNMIDLEFTSDDPKEKVVRERWKELRDLYDNYKATPNPEEKSGELNAALLAAIGESLGYHFDKVYLRRGGYYPEFLGNVEVEQHTLRRQLLELLDGTGRRKLPIAAFEQKFTDIKSPEK